MANTQIADVYVPLTFNRRAQEAQIETNAFLSSGIAVSDPTLAAQFATGGTTAELPQFNGIGLAEANIGSDDPAVSASTAKISSSKQIARSASRNYHWSTMDLARELALEDPMGAITNRVGAFWAADDEHRLIASVKGVLADNVANDSGDMVNDIYTASTPADSNKISPEAIIDTLQTLGDKKASISVIAMHSVQHAKLQLLQLLVDNINPVTGELVSQSYLGKTVVIDDSLEASTTDADDLPTGDPPKYMVAFFGAGAFSFAAGPVQTPSAITRNELVGNGAGETVLSSRVNSIFHPNGFQCVGSAWGSTAAGSYAELAAAGSWDRVVLRKNVPLAFLTCNG